MKRGEVQDVSLLSKSLQHLKDKTEMLDTVGYLVSKFKIYLYTIYIYIFMYNICIYVYTLHILGCQTIKLREIV